VPVQERRKLSELWARYGVTEEDALLLAAKMVPAVPTGGL
jgi:hypothetical protein